MASKGGFMFTVGKVDAGMAILIGERAHLIEFPSILLPNGCTSGSIVNISVHRNVAEEKSRKTEFWALQDQILETFGIAIPETPKLILRNTTQTAVTLEWPTIKLATATLRSLDLYRNGVRLSTIPTPLQQNSTKISGLQLDADYTFQLILRTSAGTYPSNVIKVRTHKISDTSGISVCFGNVADPTVLEDAKNALQEMGAKWSDKIQIDTTHFVCNTPATAGAGPLSNTPGVEYQRALQLSIPVVQPTWILACHAEHKMVPISNYYLGTSTSPGPATGSTSKSTPRTGSLANVHAPQKPTSPTQHSNRASLPVRMDSRSPPSTAFVNQDRSATPAAQSPDEEQIALEKAPTVTKLHSPPAPNGKARGQMNKAFRFPSPTTESASLSSVPLPEPSPPPIIEKDRPGVPSHDSQSEVGETEEVDLS